MEVIVFQSSFYFNQNLVYKYQAVENLNLLFGIGLEYSQFKPYLLYCKKKNMELRSAERSNYLYSSWFPFWRCYVFHKTETHTYRSKLGQLVVSVIELHHLGL